MNAWPSDQYGVIQNNMMGMMPQMAGMAMVPNNMMPNMPMQPAQPMGNMGANDWQNPIMNIPNNSNFIGPEIPKDINQNSSKDKSSDNKNTPGNKQGGSDTRRDRDRRGHSPDRGSRDNRDHRSRSDRRERRSKWSDNDNNRHNTVNNIPQQLSMPQVPPGNMMGYPNQMMDMQQMGTYQNMSSMAPMGNMAMGMGMMDQNQIMMAQLQMQMGQQGQHVSMGQQALYISNGVLLPPIPGVSTPARREKPPGCRTIFVGGLPSNINEQVIMEIFQRFGNIVNVKLHRQGVCHVRFEKHEVVEQSFFMSGYRYKLHDQTENEATTLFVDYALNREDQSEYERNKKRREPTPPKIEPFNPTTLNTITEKIKSDTDFAEAAPTLAGWLEHGECNKKNANTFYSLIQASNSQVRRLYNEKMNIDEEFQNLKSAMRDKFALVVSQFEQVAKILAAAKHQRVSDHFSKQQRRNIEMWLKMTEDLENIKEEFNSLFDDDENEVVDTKDMVPLKKYEELKAENESLVFEVEGYKNEAFLARDEAERRFEKFKAQYVAQQALHAPNSHQPIYPPLPPPPLPNIATAPNDKPTPPSPVEAKLISLLTAYLLSQPFGATLDTILCYIKSILPHATQAAVHNVLRKYYDVFREGAEARWSYVTFDIVKKEKAS